ncbi:TPA: hypothetical protein ACH3X2_008991 [Trebouxia sp. C0005]
MGCSAHPVVTLPDMVHAAPRILEMLDPESVKAVSATCSLLHSWVCKGVTALTLPNYHHLRLLQPQRWPNLYVVCISSYDDMKPARDQEAKSDVQLIGHKWLLLAYIIMTSKKCKDTDRLALLFIRPHTEQFNSHGLASGQVHLQAMGRLAKHSKAAEARCLFVSFTDKAESVIAQLASLTWPNVSDMVLVNMGHSVGTDAFLHLSITSLPSLKTLMIMDNRLDAQAVLNLANSCPRIICLQLINTNMDAAAVQQLSSANWPCLEALSIEATAGMNASTVQQLAQGNWPLLKKLDLRCSNIDQRAIVHLTQGNWPLLKTLTLDRKCMTEAVCEWLQIRNVSEQLQAMQSAMMQPDFSDFFQLERLSSTVWPHLTNIRVILR